MLKLHDEYPHYAWNSNKGYGTKLHCKAIEEHGQTKYHRKTFRLKLKEAELNFD
jgi:ribonuclease HII